MPRPIAVKARCTMPLTWAAPAWWTNFWRAARTRLWPMRRCISRPPNGPANLEMRTSRTGWSARGDRMNVVLFGASGMVGQGVLRECLLDPAVESVLSIGRSTTGERHPKLRELAHRDFLDFSPIENQLSGFDACFFCLGISSAGMSEEQYTRVTYSFTIAAARAIAK